MQTLYFVFVTPFYAAILALLFMLLSVRTLRLRQRLKVLLGDGDQPQMLRAMRVHANFAEYVPLALLLTVLLESRGTSAGLIHALCLGLLLGRLAHAYGVSQVAEDMRYRSSGWC